ncbi:MAG: hypothetical protein WC845_02040 [Candidatus Staskawiczbacteria bacterium]|jgi:hypothetical protein
MVTYNLKTEKNLEEFLLKKEKSVLFVHNKESADYLVRFKRSIEKGDCVVIPTSVEVLFVLNKVGLPYQVPESYYTLEEHYNYIKNLEPKVINLAAEIDRELENNYPEIKQSGLKLAFYHLYPFVRSYYPLVDAYFKIKKIIQKEKPDKIGMLIGQKKDSKIDSEIEGWLLQNPKENLFEKVFGAYQINLPIYLFSSNEINRSLEDTFSRKNWKNNIGRKFFRSKPWLFRFFKVFKKDWLLALKLLYYQSKLTPLFLFNGGYNWDLCDKELYRKGYYIWGQSDDTLRSWYLKSDRCFKLSGSILQRLNNLFSFRKNFQEENIDFYPLIKNKLVLFLEKVVPASLNAFFKTADLIKKKKIKGVLFCSSATAISKSIARAAQNNNIPVIGWQHGGDIDIKKLSAIVLNDLLVCDLFLNWGEGSNENMREVSKQLKLDRKQKNIGSASLDELISMSALDSLKVLKKIGVKSITRPIIVYATNMYYLSNNYNVSYPSWSDNYIYDTQKKIIERLALLAGTKIIKLHPNLFYSVPSLDEYCNSFKRQNVWSTRNKVTASLLFSIADVVVVDFPSTVLLQSMACKKPTFCLTRHLKIEDKISESLIKRVVLSEDPELLMKEVECFLKSGKYKADLENTEFLEKFGTLMDCRSAERAVAAVDELVISYR